MAVNKLVTELSKRLAVLEEQLSAGGNSETGGILKSMLPDGSVPSSYQLEQPMSNAVVLSNSGYNSMSIEQAMKEREDAAYHRGVNFGIAVMGLIGATILLKMLR